MDNVPNQRAVTVLLIGLLILVLAGCGDDDDGATTTTSTTTTSSTTTTTSSATTSTSTTTTTVGSTSSTQPTTASTAPATSQSATTEPMITIGYLCGDGDTGSTDVATGDIEEIDDIINTIDLCEFKGGLTEISFTAPCPSGDREVTVVTVDGAVPDIATLDLCENP